MFFVDKGIVLYAQYCFFSHLIDNKQAQITRNQNVDVIHVNKISFISMFYKTDESVIKQTPNYVCGFVNSHCIYRHINEVII